MNISGGEMGVGEMGIGEKWANHRQNGSRRNRNILLGKGLLFVNKTLLFSFSLFYSENINFSV